MTPSELLAGLTARGVALVRNGDRLRAQAEPGVLTDTDRADLRRYKLALLSLLDPDSPVTFPPLTLDDLAGGVLEQMGVRVERFDNDLHGEPWQPTLYLKSM